MMLPARRVHEPPHTEVALEGFVAAMQFLVEVETRPRSAVYEFERCTNATFRVDKVCTTCCSMPPCMQTVLDRVQGGTE